MRPVCSLARADKRPQGACKMRSQYVQKLGISLSVSLKNEPEEYRHSRKAYTRTNNAPLARSHAPQWARWTTTTPPRDYTRPLRNSIPLRSFRGYLLTRACIYFINTTARMEKERERRERERERAFTFSLLGSLSDCGTRNSSASASTELCVPET